MAKYEVTIKPSAVKDIGGLPDTKIRQQVVSRILRLAENPRPHGCEKLSGAEKYRVRQGDYRIIYEVNDKQVSVLVVKVGHRREVYRDI